MSKPTWNSDDNEGVTIPDVSNRGRTNHTHSAPVDAKTLNKENLQEAVNVRWPDQFQIDLMRQAAKRELARTQETA